MENPLLCREQRVEIINPNSSLCGLRSFRRDNFAGLNRDLTRIDNIKIIFQYRYFFLSNYAMINRL